jgi:hypothetical protein
MPNIIKFMEGRKKRLIKQDINERLKLNVFKHVNKID